MLHFTSDWHFNHANVINYCQRPFRHPSGEPHVEAMNDALVDLWNNTVKPSDTIYFLGDFSMNPKWSTRLVPKLNGEKHLIWGNHDAHVFKLPPGKVEKARSQFLRDGWVTVGQFKRLVLKDGTPVLLSHLPYASEEGCLYDQRYNRERPMDEPTILLHGHLHNKYIKFGKMLDVGIDGAWKIWSEDDIIGLINDPREIIPGQLTEFYKNNPSREMRNAKSY